jgi:hypothetical protein
MKKYINTKNLYLLTVISFALTLSFLYFFAHMAPHFYTGFDYPTSPNKLSNIVNFIFLFLVCFNLICVILSAIYLLKALFKK